MSRIVKCTRLGGGTAFVDAAHVVAVCEGEIEGALSNLPATLLYLTGAGGVSLPVREPADVMAKALWGARMREALDVQGVTS